MAKDKIEGEGVKVVNHSLRHSTIELLKDHARETGRPMARIVDQAIREYIERNQKPAP